MGSLRPLSDKTTKDDLVRASRPQGRGRARLAGLVVKIQRAPTGVDLYRIGRLLGHGHLSTTSRYLHLARSKLTGHPSPLELLAPLT